MKTNTRKLDGFSSIFLDSLRLLCALLVVIGHCSQILAPGWQSATHIFDFGHGAVIIFFVLSGYVIAHTTSGKRRSFNEYLVARFSRLYSICFPAILITAICALTVFILDKNVYFDYDRGNNLLRYLLTLFFCNELWFSSTAPPMNGPFWSLSFEFWYYMLFACIYYKSKSARGVLLAVAVSLFIGPKILLMLPIWCSGWLGYKITPLNISVLSARFLAFTSLLAAFLLMETFQDYPFKTGAPPFYMANAFISDTCSGVFIALACWLLPTNTETKLNDSGIIKKFRFFANLTYPIYLFHFPVFIVCRVVLSGYNLSDSQRYFTGLFITLSFCVLSGAFFDSLRYKWIRFFQRMFKKIMPGRFIN